MEVSVTDKARSTPSRPFILQLPNDLLLLIGEECLAISERCLLGLLSTCQEASERLSYLFYKAVSSRISREESKNSRKKLKAQSPPLHRAAGTGDVIGAKVLLDEYDVGVDWQNHQGKTALHLATVAGQHRMIEFLLSRGAYIEARDAVFLQTPLCMAAVLPPNTEVNATIDLLLLKGADISALHDFATENGNYKSVTITTLFCTVWEPDEDVLRRLEFLVERKVDVGYRGPGGDMVLHHFIYSQMFRHPVWTTAFKGMLKLLVMMCPAAFELYGSLLGTTPREYFLKQWPGVLEEGGFFDRKVLGVR